jgi:tetratricopeptide (TPR) repeat protein
MTEKHMFRYTPSMMGREDLEALFVQREDLLSRVVDLVRDGVLTPAKHHYLLVGPRGTGKTHTVSLVYHRCREQEEIFDKLVIAWLREEEWGVSLFLDLLLRILRVLQEESPNEELAGRIEALFGMSQAEAERAAGDMLKDYVGDRTLLLIVENLDSLFEGLANEGQQRLRAYLQENPFCTIVATAPSLFSGVSRKNSPFYGFFAVQHLENLNPEQARKMLVKIARHQGDEELAALLQTPVGKARVKAIHHLAGGNHRIYVILAQFLTSESLDQLVDPFLGTMDDLTPYYQSRMMLLSPQQRKVVEFLCEKSHPVAVKDIAQRCFMTHQTASSQLKKLREMCYVASISVGREAYYELREPLMRLCLEVKKYRGEPIRLFVDFLRYWYSRSDINKLIDGIEDEAGLEKEYLNHALKLYERERSDPKIQECMKRYEECRDKGDNEGAKSVADQLLALLGHKAEAVDYIRRAIVLRDLGDFAAALDDFNSATEIEPSVKDCWLGKGVVLVELNRHEESLAALSRAIDLGADRDGKVWALHGYSLSELERYHEALKSFERAIALGIDSGKVWVDRFRFLLYLERYDEALDVLDERDGNDMEVVGLKIPVLMILDRADEAEKLLADLGEVKSSDVQYWHCRGRFYLVFDRYDEAFESFSRAMELKSVEPEVYYSAGFSLLLLQRWPEAFGMLDDALQRFPGYVVFGSGRVEKIVAKIWSSSSGPVLRKQIQILTELYAKHDVMSELGQCLVASIETLQLDQEGASSEATWYREWKKQTDSYPEMQLPLRLLDVAIRYREKQDVRILLELPVEERSILEPLLGIEEPASTTCA